MDNEHTADNEPTAGETQTKSPLPYLLIAVVLAILGLAPIIAKIGSSSPSSDAGNYNLLKDELKVQLNQLALALGNDETVASFNELTKQTNSLSAIEREYKIAKDLGSKSEELDAIVARYAEVASVLLRKTEVLAINLTPFAEPVFYTVVQMQEEEPIAYDADAGNLKKLLEPVNAQLKPLSEAAAAVNPIAEAISLQRDRQGADLNADLTDDEILQAAKEVLNK
jgi:hypothetical protein